MLITPLFTSIYRVTLGSSPYGEEPVQVRPDGTHTDPMKAELQIFRAQMERVYSEAHGGRRLPSHVRLIIARRSHDFGTYYELEARCGEHEDTTAVDWLEGAVPELWDPPALEARAAAGFQPEEES